MKVLIKAGTRGWMENGKNAFSISVTFREDMTVDVEPIALYWYKTKGEIPGFPEARSILVNHRAPSPQKMFRE